MSHWPKLIKNNFTEMFHKLLSNNIAQTGMPCETNWKTRVKNRIIFKRNPLLIHQPKFWIILEKF